jgi:FkbM family methyltransferase
VPKIKEFAAKLLLALGYSIKSKTKKSLIQRVWGEGSDSSISRAQERVLLRHSKSQLGQDLLGLSVSGLDKPGFFVEFGASDGVALSNSHILEKHFGWTGILCEPSTGWHDALKKNRSCTIDTRCVYSVSGEKISFSENYLGELSAITALAEPNANGVLKRTTSSYVVETVSLLDLLKFHNAPKFIDFLSIDTEGSEFEILSSLDYDKYNIKIITCEHNYTSFREKIFELLTSKNYKRKFENLSKWDDWYIKE